MSQDFINNLPPEMLHQVFEYLDPAERTIAADVCKRWFDILSSERYLGTLELKPHHLTTNFDDVRRYRSILIDLPPDSYELATLRRLLQDKAVMAKLEELHIDFRDINWQKLSNHEELHFPKLRKITFQSLQSCDQDILLREFIPSWMEQRRSIWIFGDQIKTLVIEYSPSLVLPKAELFPNLRSLTLGAIEHVSYADEDSFRMITRQLKELDILQVDSLDLRNIFRNADELETLSIFSDTPMPADTYNAINNMKKLKHLSLSIPIDEKASGLTLQNLQKLAIADDDLIPLKSVPNLRSLRIECDFIAIRSVSREKMTNYYRLFGHQLQHLTLMSLLLDNVHVSQICALSNLQSLEICTSEVEFADVEKICQSIGKLKLLRLEQCIIATEMILSDKSQIEQAEELKTCFNNLRVQYVRCAIVTDDCTVRSTSEARI